MYLLDSSAIITPFHRAQCGALSLALGHETIDETLAWLKRWYIYGFSSGNLVVTYEIYDEVVNKCKKESRVERKILKELHKEGKITFPEVNDEFYEVLVSIDGFVRRNYEPHQAETFLKKVDPNLVALAKVHGATLVVEERHFIPERDGTNGRIKGEPRLPFVAATLEVKCMSIMAIMLVKHREWGQLLEEV